jgi:iron(III) transport system permease protein
VSAIVQRLSSLSVQQVLLASVLLVVGLLTLLPLILLLLGAVTVGRPSEPGFQFTLDNLVRAYTNDAVWGAAVNTLVYSVGVSAVAVILGTFLAWAVERTNMPFRNLVFILTVVRLVFPGILLVVSWILLLGPTAGWFNVWLSDLFGLEEPPFNIFSMSGMIFVEGLQNIPVAFLLMLGAFRSLDPSLEEAARTSGASLRQVLTKVSLPLARPALVAATLLVFVNAFEGFETPQLLGLRADEPVRTFSTEIFQTARRVPTDFNLSSAYSTIFLAVAFIGVLIYARATRNAERFATVTGKGFRPRSIDLGRWRWLVLMVSFVIIGLAFLLPLAALLWRSLIPFTAAPSPEMFGRMSLVNYEFVLDYAAVWRALGNSLLVAAGSATLVMIATAVAAWITVRSKVRGKSGLDLLLFIPIALPGIVLGLALLWGSLTFAPAFYATVIILVIAHSIRFLPYGMRFSASAMAQIHKDLEEVAYVSGANWWQAFRRITVPLLMPALLAGFIFVLIASVRELSASVLLTNVGTHTLPVIIFNLWDNGQAGEVSSLAIITMVILMVLVGGVRFLGSRTGVRGA